MCGMNWEMFNGLVVARVRVYLRARVRESELREAEMRGQYASVGCLAGCMFVVWKRVLRERQCLQSVSDGGHGDFRGEGACGN